MRRSSVVVAVLLSAPLALLTAWVLRGAAGRSHGVAVAAPSTPAPPAGPLASLPAPKADLAADRLEDRVDGAAEYLRGQGCRRLLYWRLEELQADLELLVFATEAGARTALARDAGSERTPGLGDEAQVSAQAVYFRRGAVLVRLLVDPGRETGDAAERRARQVDEALMGTGARL
jgi:hypothetical protein